MGKISSIRICTLGGNMGHKNGHNSSPRASPRARIWHAPSYHIPKGFSMPKGTQFELNQIVFEDFGGVIQMHNPINRAPCTSFKGGRVLPLG